MSSNQEFPLHTIDRTPEYEEFIEKLRVYHEKRGTPFDPEPKVSNTSLDLLKVFKLVVESGGYDKVSDEKLAWRRMREVLGIPTSNIPAAAYTLKEKYLRTLAAYEISTIHGKEPPPRDILEDCTAKGGSLLTRTRENFHGGKHGDDSAASGDDGTPSRERPSADTTPVSSVRATRGLREAPPQRVIFQPDTGPTRPRPPSASHTSTPTQFPQSGGNRPGGNMAAHTGSTPYSQNMQGGPGQSRPQQRGPSGSFNPQNMENTAAAVESYMPRSLQAPIGLPVRPAETPSYNPTEFNRRRLLARQRALPPPLPAGTPGVGRKDLTTIYQRCLMGLLSQNPDEQAYALHHLVKISFERGDKFRFDQFHDLPEGLVSKVLEVGSLFFDVTWKISWIPSMIDSDIGVLDAEFGNPDILERIEKLQLKDVQLYDNVMPGEIADQLVCISEAALTIRNMLTLPDNANFISRFNPLKDMICIVLRLPNNDHVIELKHLILEIAELVTPFMTLDNDEGETESEDPLYQVLLEQVQNSEDRGMVLSALRAVGRISMRLDKTNRLNRVPPKVLENISRWLFLNDEELMDACLDLLYQYTAVPTNVDTLLRAIVPEQLVQQLVRLLAYGARASQRDFVIAPEQRMPPMDHPAVMPESLFHELMKMNEPDRCQQWIKSFFEQDPESFVTQITAWQAYNNAFAGPVKNAGQNMITPADFIRNSTTVYKHSKAEVRQFQGEGENQQKFIIQGLRARVDPRGIDGKEFRRCLWGADPAKKCGQHFRDAEALVEHILRAHIGASPNEDGKWENAENEYTCTWSGCTRYDKPTKLQTRIFVNHIMTHAHGHFFTTETIDPEDPFKNLKPGWVHPAKTMTLTYEETPYTREGPNKPAQPAGIPLSAALILRNIARNAPKTRAQEELLKQHERGGEGGGYNERLFRLLRPRLSEIMAKNEALRDLMSTILDLVDQDTDV
ncbi:hypothetical protein B0T11DRAFT_54369 [Plectosphaerella cucumerina]|uniref:Uncharacterized protein n=1 Tax=Plectosphaerella cucumerina TaxID=40658 RepID=A0A8K0TL11_9PEZI|nr:hypothetical protein B0T11DRAFT_54369 [Plectosphaerella cucumerina]